MKGLIQLFSHSQTTLFFLSYRPALSTLIFSNSFMGNDDVQLIGAWPSPFVLRARIALNLKSVKYDFLEEKIGTKSELLLKSNPVHKKIPVLIHDGKPICESLIIVQYIDEAWSSGESILPSDPHDRATARFWAAYLDDKWYPALKGAAAAQGEAKAAAIGAVVEGLAYMEEALVKIGNGKSFFGGEKIGYLDVAFGGFLAWLKVHGKMNNVTFLDEAKVPNLVKWAEAFCSDPTVKDVMPDTDKLFEIAKIIASKYRKAN